MEKFFRVLRVYDGPQLGKELTKHYAERSDRLKQMHKDIKLHCAFVVDKNHPNGLEVHEVYNDGTIKIYNLRTGRFITVTTFSVRPKRMRNRAEIIYDLCHLTIRKRGQKSGRINTN